MTSASEKLNEARENLKTLQEHYKHYLVGDTLNLLAQVAEDIAGKDKQIAELKKEIERLDKRAAGLWEVIHRHEAGLEELKARPK